MSALAAARLPLESICIAPGRRARTLIVNGVHLTSGDDRVKEAFAQSMLIPYSAPEAWIYGFGLGDLPRILLQRPTLERLHAVVMNREIAEATRVVADSAWMSDPRVTVHLPGELGGELKTPFAVCPVEMRMADDDAMALRDQAQEALNQDFYALMLSVRREQEAKQLEANWPSIESDPSVAELFGKWRACPVIVVMGGPSAPAHYDWIDLMQKAGMIVLASSTMLLPLLAAGIRPDVVICVDTSPQQVRHFDGVADLWQLGCSFLVYGQSIASEIVGAWPSGRYHASIGGDLIAGGSVVHSACDLAVKAGSQSVYLIGADFSYPRGRSHAEGVTLTTPTAGDWRPQAVNGHGERVKSDPNLLSYRRELELYVKHHPEVNWYKLGREGLPVEGMTWIA